MRNCGRSRRGRSKRVKIHARNLAKYTSLNTHLQDAVLRTMKTETFSKTTSLLLIATLTLALAGTVSAEIVNPAEKYDGEPLKLLTFFLFFVGYISMGAAF